MNCRRFVLLLVLLTLSLTLTACGGFPGPSEPSSIDIAYLPTFNFGAFSPQTMIPDVGNNHAVVLYYMYSPALVTFVTNSTGLKAGDTYKDTIVGKNVTIKISTDNTAKTITYTGKMDDPTDPYTTITVTINTAKNTFSYEEFLICEENPTAAIKLYATYAVVYASLKDVPMTSNGYFHTRARIMVAEYQALSESGPVNTGFTLLSDCYNGLANSTNAANDGHHISGYYLTSYLTCLDNARFNNLPTNISDLDKTTIASYFTDLTDTTKWMDLNSVNNDMKILYFDHDLAQFYSTDTSFYTPSEPVTAQPWDLL